MEQIPNFLTSGTRPTIDDRGILVFHIDKYGGMEFMEEYLDKNRETIYEYILDRLCYSVRAGESEIELFALDLSPMPITSVREDWMTSLKTIQDFYLVREEYERCAVTKQLIDILNNETTSIKV